MKYDTYDKYPPAASERAKQALLTVWDCLPRYRHDLVLVGGLAIHFLTHAPEQGLPGPVTMDVDLAIDITSSTGQYDGIRTILAGHGFTFDGQRFSRDDEDGSLYIDLLTYHESVQTAMVDDGLPVGVRPGVERALNCWREVSISGRALRGDPCKHTIRIAEVGPLLVLKLNAFGGPDGRKASKDAHDILYLAMHYLDGPQGAIEGFHAEASARNNGFATAITCLHEYFATEDAAGPMACAAFRLNNQHLSKTHADASLRIRQQCVTLAQRLLQDHV